jgi:hypothetical protein
MQTQIPDKEESIQAALKALKNDSSSGLRKSDVITWR